MKIIPLTLLTFSLAACDVNTSAKIVPRNSQRFEAGRVVFVTPMESSSVRSSDTGFSYDGKSFKAETKGDYLFIDGKNYGLLRAGDHVDLTKKGIVLINGAERVPESAEQDAAANP